MNAEAPAQCHARVRMPIVLLVTLTAIYAQEGKMFSVYVAIIF